MDPPGTHPDRHDFVHSVECNKVWKALIVCNEQHNWFQRCILNKCEWYQFALDKCYKNERRLKRDNNHRLAQKQLYDTVKKLADMDPSEDI